MKRLSVLISNDITSTNWRHYLQDDKLIAPDTAISLRELLDRKSVYNKTQIHANALAAGGAALGITGTAISLAGLPAVVGVPAAIGGAVIGLKGSVRNTISTKKENTFKGKGASHEAREQVKKLHADDLDITATKDFEKKYLAFRQALAQTKFFSLVDHVLQKEGKSANITPEMIAQRHRSLSAMIQTGNKGPRFKVMSGSKLGRKFDRKTTLLDNELRLMHSMYEEWAKLQRFSGTADMIREQMAKELINNEIIKEVIAPVALLDTVKTLLSASEFRKTRESLLAEAASFSSEVNELTTIAEIEPSVLEKFIKNNATAREIYYSNFLKHALEDGKRDLKYLRYEAAKAIIKMEGND